MNIAVTVELPDFLVERLKSDDDDIPRKVLEAVAIEAYRSDSLTSYEVMNLLGLESRMELDGFLKKHKVYDYTLEDLEQDRQSLNELFGRQ